MIVSSVLSGIVRWIEIKDISLNILDQRIRVLTINLIFAIAYRVQRRLYDKRLLGT